MGVCKLEVWLNTIMIYDPGVLVKLEAFNKYIFIVLNKVETDINRKTRSKRLSGCGPQYFISLFK